jgi:hypothetical protein
MSLRACDLWAALVCATCFSTACEHGDSGSAVSSASSDGSGPSTSSSAASSVTGVGGGDTSSSASAGGACPISQPVSCDGDIYDCGDGLDNDGDGLFDADDPECMGPCDGTEESLHPGDMGSQDPGCITDCYFDENLNSGDDDCHWSHKCDPLEIAPDYHPESFANDYCAYDPGALIPGANRTCDELSSAQTEFCYSSCLPLTPNGCDCFGCCELVAGSGQHVWLGSLDAEGTGSCTLAVAGDPTKCSPCTPVPGCLNACDTCELCVGKTTLPPECGTTPACAPGVQACGAGTQCPCPSSSYCVTGCCQPAPAGR